MKLDIDLDPVDGGVSHSLEGHFLIAMPAVADEPFARTVIYVCAHSPNGAMGFIINKSQPMSFPALLTQLGIVESEADIRLPSGGREVSVCIGPKTAIMALGYSGWAPGQLEEEIAANGWLTCKADLGIVFDTDLDAKYKRALGLLGIEPAFLAGEAGHA